MRRRELMLLLGGGAAAALPIGAAVAQQTTPVIGFLSSGNPAGWGSFLTGFYAGLNEIGFVEGRNVAIQYRWAEGHYDQLLLLGRV